MKKLFRRISFFLLFLSVLTVSGIFFSSCEKDGTSSENGSSSSSSQQDFDSSFGDSSQENGTGEDGEHTSGGGLINGGNYEAH